MVMGWPDACPFTPFTPPLMVETDQGNEDHKQIIPADLSCPGCAWVLWLSGYHVRTGLPVDSGRSLAQLVPEDAYLTRERRAALGSSWIARPSPACQPHRHGLHGGWRYREGERVERNGQNMAPRGGRHCG